MKKANKIKKPALYGMFLKISMDLNVIGYDLFKEDLITSTEMDSLTKTFETLEKLNEKIKGRL